MSFDDTLLRRIDRSASEQRLTRSAYLSALAQADHRGRGSGASAVAQAALRELDELFGGAPPDEVTVAVRAARDAR